MDKWEATEIVDKYLYEMLTKLQNDYRDTIKIQTNSDYSTGRISIIILSP